VAVTTSPSTASESSAPTWEQPSASTLTWLLAGVVFLALGAFLLLLVSVQTVAADVFTVGAATNVGRLRPAAFLLVTYGGLGMLGNGAALDVARRLAKAPVQLDNLSKAAGAIVTVGVVGSVLAVLTGHGNGRVGFEMPRPLAVLIALGQLLLLCSVLRTVSKRREDEVHPSLWFVVGALFCAPVVILFGALPRVRGVNDEMVLAFGLSGLKLLWLVPLALGLALYAIPVSSRAPLHSRQLAVAAFWGWFVFAPFAGAARLAGGPAQDWLESVGIAATIALGAGVLAYVTLVASTYARRTALAHGADLRFGLAAAGLLGAWALLAGTTAGRTAGDFLHASVASDGLSELALLGVAAAGILAGVFHVLPAASGNRITNPRLAANAAWPLVVGVLLVALSLLVAGYVQGVLLAQGVRDGSSVATGDAWVRVTDAIRPLLWLRVVGEVLVTFALVTAFQQVFSTSTAGDPLAPEES
jgi:cbb3-type cytochrome oxidase subunit 1